MAKMGRGSRSFLRFRENVEFLGEAVYIQDQAKKNILDFMHRFEYNDRAVYFAENVQTMTGAEMQQHLKELGSLLHHAGANGVIEFHPTADGTSKSAHIHYWGELSESVENIIVDYIKQNRLSNKDYLNYTNEEMRAGTEHKIVKGKLVEYEFDRRDEENIERSVKREMEIDEEEIAIKRKAKSETFYDDIIAYCDDVLAQFGIDEEISDKELKEIDMDTVNRYIMDLEMDLYE